ncbi:hypothetical protein Tco_0578434 [Tanacetum coccineum]
MTSREPISLEIQLNLTVELLPREKLSSCWRSWLIGGVWIALNPSSKLSSVIIRLAEVVIRSSKEANTSYAVATNLCELELKKILIDKMENNKSIDRSVQQITLYKALVDAYETNKDILATYGVTVTFKRRRDDEDEDDEPSAGSNQGSKIRKAGKEHESTSAPKDKTSKSTDSSKEGSKSITGSTNKSAQAEEQVHTFNDLEEPAH